MSQATVMADVSAKKESRLYLSVKYRNIIVEIISALFVLLFVYTAFSKFLDFKHFKEALGYSPLFKDRSAIFAWIIPSAELIIALGISFSRFRLPCLYGALFLMSVFTIYIGWMIIFASHLPCSCGGVTKYMNWQQHFIFNLFFTLIALIGVYLLRNHPIKNFK